MDSVLILLTMPFGNQVINWASGPSSLHILLTKMNYMVVGFAVVAFSWWVAPFHVLMNLELPVRH